MTIRNWMAMMAACVLVVAGIAPASAGNDGLREPHREKTAVQEQSKALPTSRKIAGFGVLGVLIVWIFTRDMMARKKAKKESPADKEDSDDENGHQSH